MSKLIDTSEWGRPDHPDLEDLVKLDGKSYQAALAEAYSAGANDMFNDLCAEIKDGMLKLYSWGGDMDDYVRVPLDKLDAETQGIVQLKDWTDGGVYKK